MLLSLPKVDKNIYGISFYDLTYDQFEDLRNNDDGRSENSILKNNNINEELNQEENDIENNIKFDKIFFDRKIKWKNKDFYINNFILEAKGVKNLPDDLSQLSSEALKLLIRWLYNENIDMTYSGINITTLWIELALFFKNDERLFCYFSIKLYNLLRILKIDELLQEFSELDDELDSIFPIFIKVMKERIKEIKDKKLVNELSGLDDQSWFEECVLLHNELRKIEINGINSIIDRLLGTDIVICVNDEECINAHSSILGRRFPLIRDTLIDQLKMNTNKKGKKKINLQPLDIELGPFKLLVKYYYTYRNYNIDPKKEFSNILKLYKYISEYEKLNAYDYFGNIDKFYIYLESFLKDESLKEKSMTELKTMLKNGSNDNLINSLMTKLSLSRN